MLIVGTLQHDNNVLFRITTGQKGSRWDIFADTSFTDPSKIKIDSYDLINRQQDAYNDYLISSTTMTTTGQVNNTFGPQFLRDVLQQLMKDSGVFEDILRGRITTGSVTQGLSGYNIISYTSDFGTITPLKNIEYTKHKQNKNKFYIEKNSGADAFALSLKRHRMKTYDDLKHRMAFMYDLQGNLIKDYKLILNTFDFENIMNELTDEAIIDLAFDTETTGLNFFYYGGDTELQDQLAGLSLSWKDNQGIYIPFLSTHAECLSYKILERLVPLMNTKRIITHNGLFDKRVMYSVGYNVVISEDTLVMAFNIDSRVSKGKALSKKLKTLTRLYFNHETLELDEILGSSNFDARLVPEIGLDLLKVYGCSDTDYTLKLYNVMKDIPFARHPYDLDISLIDLLTHGEYYSAKLDMDLLNTLNEINEKDIETLERLMRDYIDIVGHRIQAVRFLKIKNGDTYEYTEEEIDNLVNNYDFREQLIPMFKKFDKHTKSYIDFNFESSNDLVQILFFILRYPVTRINVKSNTWSTGDDARKDLAAYKTDTPVTNFLKRDVFSSIINYDIKVSEYDKKLVIKEEFDKMVYQFIYLLNKYKRLVKLRGSFFAKLINEQTGGYYCTSNSLSAAETARVINPIQTLVGALKKLVVPPSEDYYTVVFDKNQIEYRVMLGLASTYWNRAMANTSDGVREIMGSRTLNDLVERLNDPTKDYHREGGSIFLGISPDDMTKQQRGGVKAVHFAVPFGAEEYTVAKNDLHNESNKSKHEGILNHARALLDSWRNKLYPLYFYLEFKRDQTFVEVPQDKLPPLLKDGKFGMVTNALGRRRWFDISSQDYSQRSRIRRQVGNFPIQSFAREIFFSELIKLFKEFKRLGYIGDVPGNDKVIMNLFIHDECVMHVHKSIHIYEIYALLLKCCLTKLKGHPTYYMGINVVSNWYEGKEDKFEAPFSYVQQCAEKYTANPEKYNDSEYNSTIDFRQMCLDEISKHTGNLIVEKLKQVQSLSSNPLVLDPTFLEQNYKDYSLTTKFELYGNTIRKSEFNYDSTISKQANNLIKYLEAYLYLHDPGLFYQMTTLYEGKQYKTSDICDVSFDLVEDSNLSLLDLDNAEIFMDDTESYLDDYLVSEYEDLENEEVTIRINIREDGSFVTEDNSEIESIQEQIPKYVVQDFMGRLVMDINGLKKPEFLQVTAYLKQFVSDTGLPFYFFQNGEYKFSGVKISSDFDNYEIHRLISPKVQSTNHFS